MDSLSTETQNEVTLLPLLTNIVPTTIHLPSLQWSYGRCRTVAGPNVGRIGRRLRRQHIYAIHQMLSVIGVWVGQGMQTHGIDELDGTPLQSGRGTLLICGEKSKRSGGLICIYTHRYMRLYSSSASAHVRPVEQV